MPGFPTMDKENVKLRTSLQSIRVDDIKDVIEGQDAMPNALRIVWGVIEEAREAQKAGQIKNAYVKIGTVKKSLMFRIKHDKGHWGEGDLMMVRVYVAPDVNDEIGPTKSGLLGEKGVLKTSAGKPEVSLAWWNKARGDNLENEALQESLEYFEGRIALIEQDPMLSRFIEADDALEQARRLAVDIHKRMTVKDDKKLMMGFIEAIGAKRDQIEQESEAYTARLEKAHEALKVDIEEIKANPERNVATFGDSIEKNAPFDVIARNFARVVPQLERSLDTNWNEWSGALDRYARENQVSVDDLEIDELRRLFNRALRDLQRINQEFDELRNLMDERQVVPQPPQARPQLNVDERKLQGSIDGFAEVLQRCQESSQRLNELELESRGLPNLEGEALVEALDRLCSGMVSARRVSVAEMKKMRDGSSLYVTMRVESGGGQDMVPTYFEPMTNLILTEAARQRRAVAPMKRVMLAQLPRVETELRREVEELLNRSFREAQ